MLNHTDLLQGIKKIKPLGVNGFLLYIEESNGFFARAKLSSAGKTYLRVSKQKESCKMLNSQVVCLCISCRLQYVSVK